MNICMFTNAYLPHVGGVARSVAFFTEDLRNRGHRVLVVSPTFPKDHKEQDDEEDVLRVPAIQNFKGSDFSVIIPMPFIISKKINDFQPDIIHSHHPYLLGDAALRAAYRRNLPLVFTHHTLYEKYTHYVPMDSEAMKRLAVLLSTRYANLCTRVVAPSQSIADLISQRGVKTFIEVIPTGVDVDFFKSGKGKDFRRHHQIPSDALVIGHLGRLAPEKNLEYLSLAIIKALKKIPVEVRFLVVGSGPSEENIREMFRDSGLAERLVMAGKQGGSDLAGAYRAMDLFVFSSKTETQGMVLAEAMAAGVPVIALDASGVREVVRDNQNGRLLPEDADTEMFARAVTDFFKNRENSSSWQKAAQDTAQEFSREASAEKLISMYQYIMHKGTQDGSPHKDELALWDKLLMSLKTEWTLLSERAGVIKGAVQKESSNNRQDNDPV